MYCTVGRKNVRNVSIKNGHRKLGGGRARGKCRFDTTSHTSSKKKKKTVETTDRRRVFGRFEACDGRRIRDRSTRKKINWKLTWTMSTDERKVVKWDFGQCARTGCKRSEENNVRAVISTGVTGSRDKRPGRISDERKPNGKISLPTVFQRRIDRQIFPKRNNFRFFRFTGAFRRISFSIRSFCIGTISVHGRMCGNDRQNSCSRSIDNLNHSRVRVQKKKSAKYF